MSLCAPPARPPSRGCKCTHRVPGLPLTSERPPGSPSFLPRVSRQRLLSAESMPGRPRELPGTHLCTYTQTHPLGASCQEQQKPHCKAFSTGRSCAAKAAGIRVPSPPTSTSGRSALDLPTPRARFEEQGCADGSPQTFGGNTPVGGEQMASCRAARVETQGLGSILWRKVVITVSG